MSHDHAPDGTVQFTQEFWDDRYTAAGQLWSGEPNPQLVAQAGGLAPGDALDVGSGEGADAIWLAALGWTVTGMDVSTVALDRAAGHAAARGAEIGGNITWQHEDLLSWRPGPERFDLVSAQFIHLPGPQLQALHRQLAAAVRPGGTLLLVLHSRDDLSPGICRCGSADMFASADQLAAGLDPGRWRILVAEAIGRAAKDPDGRPVTVKDTVLCAVRRA